MNTPYNLARRDFEALFTVVPPTPKDGRTEVDDQHDPYVEKFQLAVPQAKTKPAAPAAPMAPKILQDLEDRTTIPLQAVTFMIEAQGSAPLTFTWHKDGQQVGAVTKGQQGDGFIECECDYSHTAIDGEDDGAIFDVIISNAFGCVTSNAATLTVNAAPKKSSLEQVIATNQIPQHVIEEAKRVETRRLRIAKRLKISPSLAGLFDSVRHDTEVHFQDYQFSTRLRGANPHSFEKGKAGHQPGPQHGVDREGNSRDAHVTVFGGLSKGTGMSVEQDEADPARGVRQDAPWWFFDGHCLHDFLLRLVNKKMKGRGVRLAGKELIEKAGLDHTILYCYYVGHMQDQDIYDFYAVAFSREPGRQRGTSSPEAVKKRRLRLVQAGNKLYGERPGQQA